MDDERIRESQVKMIDFCKDADNQRVVLGITHHARRWRLYAGFLGDATGPICTGETERFTFMFEGAQFKVYSKVGLQIERSCFVGGRQAAVVEHLLAVDVPKPVPPYPGVLDEDTAFANLLYATQVSQRTGNTHVVYVDWRVVDALKVFLDELRHVIDHIRPQAIEAAVKAKEDGQVFTLFEDEEEESPAEDEEAEEHDTTQID